MNLGNIPGYYFDEEKKKYFKITADHAVESRQKYTKSNVRHEKQVAKRRKIERREQEKRQAQTIKRSRLLSIPEYAGVGLHREIGTRSLAVDGLQADDAFISQLQYQDVFVSPLTVLNAHPCPSSSQTVLTQTRSGSSLVYTRLGNICHSSSAEWPTVRESSCMKHHVAFPGLAMSTSVWPSYDPQKLLACTSGGSGNVYIASLADNDRVYQPDIELSIGDDETTFWDSAISSTGDTAAIAGSDRVIHLSMDGRILDRLPGAANSRALSWLNSTTIAASSGKKALLWDTRTRGSSSRFNCQHVITGVRSVPSSSGNQLLLSTNHGVSLHDTRMSPVSSSETSPPLLHFPILHEGPQLVFDVSTRDLVALSQKNGRRDEIRVLSLRTGREVRTLQSPADLRKRPTQLTWREDERGVEFLQACIGERVGKWCWKNEE